MILQRIGQKSRWTVHRRGERRRIRKEEEVEICRQRIRRLSRESPFGERKEAVGRIFDRELQ